MQQFKNLVAREWMQQHRAWLRLSGYFVVAAWGIFYLVALNSNLIQSAQYSGRSMLSIAAMGIQLQSAVIGGISFIFLIITIPGLPYRDIDDKSQAFWRSLPISDCAAMAVTLFMNAIVLPLFAISVAHIMSLVLSLPLWIMAALEDPTLFNSAVQFLLVMPINTLLALYFLLPLLFLLTFGNYLIRRWGILLIIFSIIATISISDWLFKDTLVVKYIIYLIEAQGKFLHPFNRIESSLFSDLKLPIPELMPLLSNRYNFLSLAIIAVVFFLLVLLRQYKKS